MLALQGKPNLHGPVVLGRLRDVVAEKVRWNSATGESIYGFLGDLRKIFREAVRRPAGEPKATTRSALGGPKHATLEGGEQKERKRVVRVQKQKREGREEGATVKKSKERKAQEGLRKRKREEKQGEGWRGKKTAKMEGGGKDGNEEQQGQESKEIEEDEWQGEEGRNEKVELEDSEEEVEGEKGGSKKSESEDNEDEGEGEIGGNKKSEWENSEAILENGARRGGEEAQERSHGNERVMQKDEHRPRSRADDAKGTAKGIARRPKLDLAIPKLVQIEGTNVLRKEGEPEGRQKVPKIEEAGLVKVSLDQGACPNLLKRIHAQGHPLAALQGSAPKRVDQVNETGQLHRKSRPTSRGLGLQQRSKEEGNDGPTAAEKGRREGAGNGYGGHIENSAQEEGGTSHPAARASRSVQRSTPTLDRDQATERKGSEREGRRRQGAESIVRKEGGYRAEERSRAARKEAERLAPEARVEEDTTSSGESSIWHVTSSVTSASPAPPRSCVSCGGAGGGRWGIGRWCRSWCRAGGGLTWRISTSMRTRRLGRRGGRRLPWLFL
jgi:hypothetical protein